MSAYIQSATADILDTFVGNNFHLPVGVSDSSALSSEQLPVPIDTTCSSSFQNIVDRPDNKRCDSVTFRIDFRGIQL